MIHSDLHIHSEYSYDSTLPLAKITTAAKERGYRQVGVTDHLNLPSNKFIGCLRRSAENVLRAKESEPLSMNLSFADIAADEIKERLRMTDINTLTPIEALNLIYEWKKLL